MHSILVVEDDEQLREVFLHSLSTQYQVYVAADSREALNEFRRHADQIDVLVIDVGLPHVNGWELAATFEGVRPGIKCLMISGHLDSCPSHDPSPSSKVWFLAKPFSVAELMATVAEILAWPSVLVSKATAIVKDGRSPSGIAER